MYESFDAMAQGACDYTLKVIPIESPEYGTMLTILATEEAVYITREQAAKFFGFKE